MGLERAGAGDQIGQQKFTCRSCLRLVTFKEDEAKYQCLLCPGIQVCQQCFKGSFHNQHKFIVKRNPQGMWEPAPRTSNPQLEIDDKLEDNYITLMEQL